MIDPPKHLHSGTLTSLRTMQDQHSCVINEDAMGSPKTQSVGKSRGALTDVGARDKIIKTAFYVLP